MLWYKSWLETRWRFAIGLAILILSAVGTVLAYPRVVKLLPLVPSVVDSGEVGRRLMEIAALSRTYRGYVWAQWVRQNMTQMLALFAALLGTGGLLSQSAGGGALFTLSLPVSPSAASTCWPTALARFARRRCCSAWQACSRRSSPTSGGRR
jgi:hypothetical protein